MEYRERKCIKNFAEQVSYIRTYLGFNPDLSKNGNGLIGKVDVLRDEYKEFREEFEDLRKLLISKLDRQEKTTRAYYHKLSTELESIKRTNISFNTFNNIGTFIVKVSAVATALFGVLKLLGWV
ncbi:MULTISPECIES: hypothetical protein [unclassified Borrelia]|uniref:hypothetical protein n=1 Tax=unclassified Borrelia TaxID=2649934 RepID=UPI001E48F4CB|nr:MULTISPECIES: hypothetical protein [unclassified Borrelia]UGQ16668.1 hypothetical protein LSO06_04955 [Borrelia sp. RT5S]UGQ17715.1 hypothetical protein LSO05_04630 [Borrelia sp. RT1S]UGQ17825.1 hypothetical protein LSO05_05185 [Borrelia sp. RT1S]